MSAFVINPYSFGGDNITSFSFVQSQTSDANATTYTITGVDFGAADSNRRVVIGFASRSGNAGHSVSSATIGGITATVLAQHTANVGGGYSLVALIAADVPTGASGTVAVTLSSGAVRAAFGVYRMLSTSAPVLAASTSADTAVTGNASSLSATVSVEKGALIAVAITFSNGATLSFSGIANNDFNATVENAANIATASQLITASSSQTVTATRSSGTDWMVLLGACLK
jgi:hypothetical protein